MRAHGPVLFLILALAAAAPAHDGRYRGPVGEVPTGGARRPIPPIGEPGPVPIPSPGLGRGFADVEGYNRWEFWWENGKDSFLHPLLLLRASSGVLYGSPEFFLGQGSNRSGRGREPLTRERVKQEVIPALLGALKVRDRELRAAVCIALGRIGDPDTAGYLEALVHHEERVVRRAAILGLGMLGEAAPLKTLVELYESRERGGEARAVAALALGLTARREALPFLTRWLASNFDRRDDQEDEQVLASVLAVGLLGEPADAAFLARLLKSSQSPISQSFLLRALGGLGDRDSVPILTEALSSRDLVVRRGAALGLGRMRWATPHASQLREAVARREEWEKKGLMSDEARAGYDRLIAELKDKAAKEKVELDKVRGNAVRALAKLLDHSGDLQAREFAAIALGRTGGEAAVGPLSSALESNVSRNLKVFAALGLGLVGDPASAPLIRSYLGLKGEENLLGGMGLALGLLRDRGSVAALEKIVKNEGADPDLRGYASLALAMMGSMESAPVIREALAHRPKDEDLGRGISLALGLLGDQESLPLLLDVLQQASVRTVKGSAAMGLGTLKDPAAIKPLVEMLGQASGRMEVRTYAAVALGFLGEGKNADALGRLARDYDYRIRVGLFEDVLSIF